MSKKNLLLVVFPVLVLLASACKPASSPPACETDSDCIVFCSPAVSVCVAGSCVCFSPDDPFLGRLDRECPDEDPEG